MYYYYIIIVTLVIILYSYVFNNVSTQINFINVNIMANGILRLQNIQIL